MRDDRRVHGEAERGVVGVGDLLLHDRLVAEVAAPAAVFFGDVEAQQSRGAGLGPELAVDLVLRGPTVLVRGGFLAEELGGVLTQQRLIVGLPRGAVIGEQLAHDRSYFPVNSGARLARNAAWPSRLSAEWMAT